MGMSEQTYKAQAQAGFKGYIRSMTAEAEGDVDYWNDVNN